MLAALRRHRIACFLGITFGVTWGAWIPLALAHHRVGAGFDPLHLLGLLGPLAGAVATTAITGGRRALRELGARMVRYRVAPRWWAIALGLPIGVAIAGATLAAAYAMFMLAPVELPSLHTLGQFTGFPVTNAVAMFVMLVAINGFGEETGWRGYLLPKLQRDRSPVIASLVTAAVWAAWHVPAFFIVDSYRAMPLGMIPMFVVGLACVSIVLTWLYNRGRNSILLAAVFHGTYNLLSGTAGARGMLAALETTVVMLIAVGLVIQEARDHHVMNAPILRTR
jgi:CAAX protease family protein